MAALQGLSIVIYCHHIGRRRGCSYSILGILGKDRFFSRLDQIFLTESFWHVPTTSTTSRNFSTILEIPNSYLVMLLSQINCSFLIWYSNNNIKINLAICCPCPNRILWVFQ